MGQAKRNKQMKTSIVGMGLGDDHKLSWNKDTNEIFLKCTTTAKGQLDGYGPEVGWRHETMQSLVNSLVECVSEHGVDVAVMPITVTENKKVRLCNLVFQAKNKDKACGVMEMNTEAEIYRFAQAVGNF
jgi:hypothetical protein